MRAVDTDLIVRVFAEDDSEQSDIADGVLAADSVFLPKTVMLEFEWVMCSVYHKPAAAIASAIERMLETANVQVRTKQRSRALLHGLGKAWTSPTRFTSLPAGTRTAL